MGRHKRGKRNKELRPDKKDAVPFVKLDYKWTLGCAKEKVVDTTVYESPELHLHGVTFTFIFEVDHDGSEKEKSRLFVVNNSESSVHFSGVITCDNQNRFEIQKEVHPGIIGLVDLDGPVLVPQFHIDLKVLGLLGTTIGEFKCEKKKKKRHRKLTRNLLQNVKNMWLDPGDISDVTINVEGETIRAHKFVLAARSPVFAGMFSSTPGGCDRVHVTDFSRATVERLVGFLYGDFPDVPSIADVDLIRELYLASDLYRVLDLREACGRELVKRVTTENVWTLVDLFYCRGDSEMAKRIADVCRRHVNVVVNTEGWKYVKARYPGFSGMVLESLAKVEK